MDFFKSLILCATACTLGACHANGNVEVKFETDQHPDTLIVSYSLMSDLVNARRNEDVKSFQDTLVMMGNKGNIALKADSAAQYRIFFPDGNLITFYAEPKDRLTVDVTKMQPEFTYTVTGSTLMDGMTELDSKLKPIEDAYRQMAEKQDVSPEQREALVEKYNSVISDFVKQNPDSPAACYALMNFDGDDYLELFKLVSPKGQKSMFYTLALKKAEAVQARAEKDRKQKEMMSGNVMAPDFKLRDLQGNEVKLSDFRGKYVVVDFWGSWCIWCIKGFPALKEAYAKYKDKLVVLGVDCQDSEQAWRDAVAKYELPWINVYNPQDSKVLADYGVQGFPTKVIVNPEGKIVNITTGEDPAFFTKLAEFMGK